MIVAEESDIGVRQGGMARAKKAGRRDRKRRRGRGEGWYWYGRERRRRRKQRRRRRKRVAMLAFGLGHSGTFAAAVAAAAAASEWWERTENGALHDFSGRICGVGRGEDMVKWIRVWEAQVPGRRGRREGRR